LSLKNDLRALGVLGDKHVPLQYLTGSIEQRLELLRGMMDTDGTVNKSGLHAGVGFVNERLADAAYQLVVSLGMIARKRIKMLPETDLKPSRPFYGVEFRPKRGKLNPFRLARKRDRVTETPRSQASRKTMRRVLSITYTGTQRTRCIAIDHPSQLFLAGDALIPTHNTRAGAEWVREMALAHPGCRIALVGRSSSDVYKTMIHGESGIMAVCAPNERPEHKISTNRLVWPNGSIAETFTAMEPDQIRGPQFHYAWADEAAAWRFDKDASGLNAWDNLKFATRLGDLPRIIATTTPKRTEFMIELLADYDAQEAAKIAGTFDPEEGEIAITRGSTYDNASNLAKSYIKDITGKYEGTNIAQQELLGLMLDDTTGALWTPSMIDHEKMLAWPDTYALKSRLPYRVVALDPSVSDTPKDECGIIVVGSTGGRDLTKRHAFVLEDASLLGATDVWINKAVEMARKWNAPIVAEATQGQALVQRAIAAVDPTVKVLLVQTGNQGKKVRADPVTLPYQQKRVHHPIDGVDTLELQLTTWDPEISKKSPDRLDALVHGVTALLIKPPKGLGNGPLTAKSPAKRQLPTGRGTGTTRAGGELGKPRR
jgi:phage terminase large subunit-like protein